jgi:hypothetical protein
MLAFLSVAEVATLVCFFTWVACSSSPCLASDLSGIEVVPCAVALLFAEQGALATITMASLTTVEKLILFHKLERDLFHRLVHDLAQDPVPMRWVIAFWLWLESDGHHDFIRRVSALPGPVVLRFVEEAIECLRGLACRGHGPAAGTGDGDGDGRERRCLPCTNALLTKPIDDAGYFEGQREILDGVRYQYRTVCLAVCDVDSNITACVPTNTSGGVLVAPPMVGSPVLAVPTAASFPLNPMASPWIPLKSPPPDDYRSLFITFSRGYPISRDDIVEFFNS